MLVASAGSKMLSRRTSTARTSRVESGGEVPWVAAVPGASAAHATTASQRFTAPSRAAGGLAETLEQLPELDRAEVLEPAKQLLLGGLDEDPPGRAGRVARDEMNAAPDRWPALRSLEVHPPQRFATGQIAEMTGAGILWQLERGGCHPRNEYSP